MLIQTTKTQPNLRRSQYQCTQWRQNSANIGPHWEMPSVAKWIVDGDQGRGRALYTGFANRAKLCIPASESKPGDVTKRFNGCQKVLQVLCLCGETAQVFTLVLPNDLSAPRPVKFSSLQAEFIIFYSISYIWILISDNQIFTVVGLCEWGFKCFWSSTFVKLCCLYCFLLLI